MLGLRREADTSQVTSQVADLAEALDAEREMNSLHEERLAELELALEDQGWEAIASGSGELELSRASINILSRLARMAVIKNPLIRRGVRIRTSYTFGEGVQLGVAHDGEPGAEAAHEWLTGQIDRRSNRAALFGARAQAAIDRDLHTDGSLFIALYTKVDGSVSARQIPLSQVLQVIHDPDDATRPIYYKVRSTSGRFDPATGDLRPAQGYVWHPALWYEPTGNERPDSIGGQRVEWDAPIAALKVDCSLDAEWGVPEVYAALDWARAYKEFLEDWSRLVRALSKFAYQVTGGSKHRRKTARSVSDPDVPAGSTFATAEGTRLEAVNKGGATVSADDGKQLRLMVGTALDLADTVLSGDADQGNRATAQSLDRPMELAMQARQQNYGGLFGDIAAHIVASAIRAGKVPGAVTVTDGDVSILVDGTELDIAVDWPPINPRDLASELEALTNAATLNGQPPANVIPHTALAREIMTRLGFTDVDDLVDQLEDVAPGDTETTEALGRIATLLREAND